MMNKTKRFSAENIDDAAKLLEEGKLVAFPTETVYGLGANALDSQAVESIFTAKGRPADNPLIVHVANRDHLKQLAAKVPETAKKLTAQFWPGPLTVIVSKASQVPNVTTANLDTVAVRMPDHPVALNLIKQAGVPLAAPSANLSGRPSPTLAQHVLEDLDGRIAGVVDGGPTDVGVESTVVDCSQTPPVLLRPGDITYKELQAVLEDIEVADVGEVAKSKEKPTSPGMKYKHYSPQADVLLIEGRPNEIATKINSLATSLDEKVGIMATTETLSKYDHNLVKNMGSRSELREISNNLFKLLREFDQEAVDIILVEGVNETGVGVAIMNRLRKAAGKVIKIS